MLTGPKSNVDGLDRVARSACIRRVPGRPPRGRPLHRHVRRHRAVAVRGQRGPPPGLAGARRVQPRPDRELRDGRGRGGRPGRRRVAAALRLARAACLLCARQCAAGGAGPDLGGWSRLVSRLEIPGRRLWRHVQPRIAPLLPVDSAPKALAVGALWGWLPCGLVYSLLATALLAGSAPGGRS